MSEYQYYEFLALETPLDGASRKSLRRISSRAKISPHGFHVVYNWGDLKADPEALLARYFDVFVYEANWGTRRFACRLPASAFTTSDLRSYFSDDEEAPLIRGGNLIIDHRSDAQPDYWEDSSEWMGLLTPVRSLLLDGDLRPLYLRWLPRFNNEDSCVQLPERPKPAVGRRPVSRKKPNVRPPGSCV